MPKSNRATVSNAGPVEESVVVRATGELAEVNPGEVTPEPETPAEDKPKPEPKRSTRK